MATTTIKITAVSRKPMTLSMHDMAETPAENMTKSMAESLA
jgi:hypothetical protein